MIVMSMFHHSFANATPIHRRKDNQQKMENMINEPNNTHTSYVIRLVGSQLNEKDIQPNPTQPHPTQQVPSSNAQTCNSNNHTYIKGGPIFNLVFMLMFTIGLLVQHQFKDVNTRWRTGRNKPPTYFMQ
jgi:hypothetical protein